MNANSHAGAENQPYLVPVSGAFRKLGIGRTKGYELIKKGRLRLVKIDGKSLIPQRSIDAFLSDLGAE